MKTSSNTQVSPGELDPSFGNEGRFALPESTGSIRAIIADGQGAYIVAAWDNQKCALFRIFADGTQDLQFGKGGVSRWDFAPKAVSRPTQLILLPDGKIMLIGVVQHVPFRLQTAFSRFNVGGSPDLIFGTKFLPVADYEDSSAALQADGKILFLVGREIVSGEGGAVLFRYLPNGDSDQEFGGQGFIKIRFHDQLMTGVKVLSVSDEQILVGGQHGKGSDTVISVVIRYFSDGSLDSSFGRSGYWKSEDVNYMQAMIAEDDSIVCSGFKYAKSGVLACISKLTRNGSFDPLFNNGKTLVVSIPADVTDDYVSCRAIAVQPDKSIVLGGSAGKKTHAYLLRALPDGKLDMHFGHQGIVSIGQTGGLFDLLLQTDKQRILAAIDLHDPRRPYVFGISI
ncbi:hypothetical protein ACIOZM_01560 [Pseudomonas sp. NPDC087346]|uniref:hypothetical protein n=1 Tax=Pseudomonas sp. NPDC087346 TaxID=3364438 RepID=UPI0037FC1350